MKKENHLSLGAINKQTNEREIPSYASKAVSKAKNYSCPCCKSVVTLKKGKIRKHHFAHKNENKVGGCNYYDGNAGGGSGGSGGGGGVETELHKEGKQVIKTLIDNKKPMIFYRKCNQCEKKKVFCINKENYNDNTRAIKEHRFNYNNSNKSADVAMLEGNEIKFIFEIWYNGKTKEENRPTDIDWFELKARDLIVKVNLTEKTEQYEFDCLRKNMKCSDCDMKNKIREQDDEMAKSIAKKEEKIRIIKEEARRKEEEARRKEEEAIRKEKWVRRKKEEEAKRKEEEAMREGEDEITRLRRKWGNGCKPLISIF